MLPVTMKRGPWLVMDPVPEMVPMVTVELMLVKDAEVRVKEPASKEIPVIVVCAPVPNWYDPVPAVWTLIINIEVEVHFPSLVKTGGLFCPAGKIFKGAD